MDTVSSGKKSNVKYTLLLVILVLSAGAGPVFFQVPSEPAGAVSDATHKGGLGTEPYQEKRDPTPRPKSGGPSLATISLPVLEQKISAHNGPVVLNFWASWCGPCRAEAPELRKIHKAFSPRGVLFLGINVNDDPASAARFLSDHGLRYPNFHDNTNGIASDRHVRSIPMTFVLYKGKVRATFYGAFPSKKMSQELERIT